jgi:sigma-E factor negative regulatory protein RseA
MKMSGHHSGQSSAAPSAVSPLGEGSPPSPLAQADPLEPVSALMDGELDERERRRCLERLCADTGSRARWALWHAVGDALRSPEVAALHAPDFSTRMADRLAAEPAIVAPRDQGLGLARRLALPGIAGAAAAAVLAVVAVPVLRDAATGGTVEIARVQGMSQPSLPSVPLAASLAQPPAPMSLPVLDRFHVYLSAHGQISGPIGMPRTSQYLRQGLFESDGQR